MKATGAITSRREGAAGANPGARRPASGLQPIDPSRKGEAPMPTLRSLRAALAALALLLLPAAASASPITVNFRLEGPNSTLFEGPLTTDTHQVSAPDNQTGQVAPRDCDGVHNGGPPANPYGYATGAPTPTSTLDTAAAQLNLPWDRTYYSAYNEIFVNSIGTEPIPASSYWTFIVNWKADQNNGGCTSQVRAGDDVVWAVYDYGSPFLQLSGTPSRAATNEAFTVSVQDEDGNGNATPGVGASVGGKTTDAQGHATIAFADAGTHTLKATRSGAVRSNAQSVCVYVPGSGDCGTDKAANGGGESTTQPTPLAGPGPVSTPAAKDTTPPQ